MDTLMHMQTIFPSCSRLIVAPACITKQCLHILHTLIRPPNQISFTLAHTDTYKTPRSLPHTTYQISELLYIPNSAWLLDVWFSIRHECAVCVFQLLLLFIPVFNVIWLCSRGAELIYFLMVGYQCLSQMNYAFLPYAISSQPGNTGTIW